MKKIIHIDMDAFYASVEERDDPKLKKIPIGVGGNSNGRGVLCTCNYIARGYGVSSAMPAFIALKKCPNLKLIKPNFKKYKEASDKIHEIFYEYTDIVQSLSLDEAYLDVTNSDHCYGSATLIAKEIKQRILTEVGLSSSAGIAPNKYLSKVASEWRKPNGLFTISPQHVDKFVENLDVRKINGIGKVTASHLSRDGIHKCSDLQQLALPYLVTKYGKLGEFLYYRCRGIDNREVETSRSAKSISVENTFFDSINNIVSLNNYALEIFEELIERFSRKKSARVRKIFVKLKTHEFKSHTSEKIILDFEQLLSNKALLFDEFAQLFKKLYFEKGEDVRLIGLGLRLDNPFETEQLSLFPSQFYQTAV